MADGLTEMPARRISVERQRAAYLALTDPSMLDEGQCVEWPGPHNENGYGLVAPSLSAERLANRALWVAHHGAIPPGLLALHHCDNPPCARVAHLFLGTVQDNSTDMVMKGRSPRNVSWSKLTDEQVAEIRQRRDNGAMLTLLAQEYNVSPSFLSRLTRGLRR